MISSNSLKSWLETKTKTVNMVNFGRSLQSSDLLTYDRIMNHTVGESFNERVFCIINGLETVPVSPINDKPYRFINFYKGYCFPNYTETEYKRFIERLYNNVGDKLSSDDYKRLKDQSYSENHRNLLQDNCALYCRVICSTVFLPMSVDFSERLFCVNNRVDGYDPLKRFVNYQKGYVIKTKTIHTIEVDSTVNGLKELFPNHSTETLRLMVPKINRIKRKNKHLYSLSDGSIGEEFVVCPLLGIRLKTINKSYIEKVLFMTVEEFENRFPDSKKACVRLVEDIKNSLLTVEENGLSKRQNALNKAVVVKKTVGVDGLTPNQKIGLNSRKTHMNRVDENGLNGYQRIAKVTRPKQIATMSKQNRCADLSERSEWKCYQNFVNWLTGRIKQHILDGKKNGRAGIEEAYQVDHMFSVIHGFKHKVSPLLLANRSNLQVLRWEDNLHKNRESSITLEQLLERANYTIEHSDFEFDCFHTVFVKLQEENKPFSSVTMMEMINEYKTKLC